MPWEKKFNEEEALGKALDAFWARGYEATSMQELVECTGVNRGSLYATYGDKRAIFLAALATYDESRRKMLAEFEARYEPREAIRRVFRVFVDTASEDGANRGCFMTNTALELAAHDDEIREKVADAQKEVEAYFARMIRKGRTSGAISQNVKPSAAARGLLASLLGILVLVRSRPDRALLQSIVEDALQRLD